MYVSNKQFLMWAPRILGIGLVLFLSIFALDAFAEGYSLAERFHRLLMHLLPALTLLVAVVFAWRWQWIGTLLFGGFSIWYLTFAWGIFPLSVYLIIVGPAILIAGLYLINWLDSYKTQFQR